MKILIVTPIFPPRTGGPSTYVWELCHRLRRSHQITVICFSPKPKAISGVSIMPLSVSGNVFFRQLRLFITIFKQAQPADLVYAQGPLVVGLASTLAAKIRAKPLLLKFVGDEVWEEARINFLTTLRLEDFYKQPKSIHQITKSLIQKLSFHFSDTVITPSHYLKNFLTTNHHVNRSKIKVIFNAIQIEKTKKIRKKPNQLVFVGRLVPWKNIDLIIQAVHLSRNSVAWKLIVVGEGPELTNLKRQVKKLEAQSWIEFLGRQSHLQTLRFIKASQKIILYSDYEGLSHTLIEAMLLQTPIVASNIKPNIGATGGYAQLVPLNQVELLARAINNKPIHTKSAFQFATQHYSWDQHIVKLNQLFKNLTAS